MCVPSPSPRHRETQCQQGQTPDSNAMGDWRCGGRASLIWFYSMSCYTNSNLCVPSLVYRRQAQKRHTYSQEVICVPCWYPALPCCLSLQEYVIAFHKKDKLLPRFILLVNFCDKCLAFGMCSLAVISPGIADIGQTQMFFCYNCQTFEDKKGEKVRRDR